MERTYTNGPEQSYERVEGNPHGSHLIGCLIEVDSKSGRSDAQFQPAELLVECDELSNPADYLK